MTKFVTLKDSLCPLYAFNDFEWKRLIPRDQRSGIQRSGIQRSKINDQKSGI